jgi:hypothetical protein
MKALCVRETEAFGDRHDRMVALCQLSNRDLFSHVIDETAELRILAGEKDLSVLLPENYKPDCDDQPLTPSAAA